MKLITDGSYYFILVVPVCWLIQVGQWDMGQLRGIIFLAGTIKYFV